MDDTPPNRPFQSVAVYEEADDDPETEDVLIGRCEILPNGHLSVLEADPARDTFLREVVNRVNSKSEILLRSQEPGTEQYAIGTVSVGRDDPGFVNALATYLCNYYGLRLG
jgi:hypothetical protein